MEQYRDLSIMMLDRENVLVYACDMAASIGEKQHDALQCPVEIVSQMCVRVPLMELLAMNATPQLVINLCGVERNPTAEKMIRGIRSELERAGYGDLLMTGSTEDNMQTTMTSIGVTVVGKAQKDQLLYKKVTNKALAVQIGDPFVGKQVLENIDRIVSYDMIEQLKNVPDVLEIVPIGSKGALNEAEQIARENQLQFVVQDETIKDCAVHQQSAGPATAVIVAVKENGLEEIQRLCPTSYVLGYFTN